LSLWLEYARYGAIAAVGLAASLAIAVRRAATPRLERASGAIAVGLALVVAIAIVVWAMVGGTLASLLPSPLLVIVTPVAYMAVAWYALAAIVVLAADALLERRSGGAR
jgi:hypothetical protein